MSWQIEAESEVTHLVFRNLWGRRSNFHSTVPLFLLFLLLLLRPSKCTDDVSHLFLVKTLPSLFSVYHDIVRTKSDIDGASTLLTFLKILCNFFCKYNTLINQHFSYVYIGNRQSIMWSATSTHDLLLCCRGDLEYLSKRIALAFECFWQLANSDSWQKKHMLELNKLSWVKHWGLKTQLK